MNAFICIIPSGKNDGQQQEHLTYISTYKLCMYKWWIFYSYMYIYSQELAYRPVHPFDDTYKLDLSPIRVYETPFVSYTELRRQVVSSPGMYCSTHVL